VRSALLTVKGVTRARVTLEPREAVVTYDPAQATIEDLLEAVRTAKGFSAYSAEVKVGP
jgi:copper chaperone CopZ